MNSDDPTLPAPKPTPFSRTEGLSDSAIQRMLSAGAHSGQWLPPTVEELQRMLPDYEVQALIGRGGMGAVYKGMQRSLDRAVAIKILPPMMNEADAQFATRFKQEARAMAKLNHPHILAIHDFGEAKAAITAPRDEPGGTATPSPSGLLYFVMEFIDGTDLQQIMKSEGHLSPKRAAALISQICDALEFAHEHDIVHRDIKPSNIMVDKRGQVKVADFGLAKTLHADDAESTHMTMTGAVMGTRAYMAPEQALGKRVDHRADIYSLGAMFYEMLTGDPPHGAIEAPSHKIELDVRMDSIVLKALAQDPDRRYQHASEIKSDVTRVTEQPVVVKKNGNGKRIALAALIVAMLAAGAFFTLRKPQGRADGPPSAAAPPQTGALGQSALPATATQAAPFINTLGMKFVPVPITGPARSASPSDAGGGPTDQQRMLFSVWETRVQDYEAFAKETKREWKKAEFEQDPSHPAVNVSWVDAQAFCTWLTEHERKAGKLGVNERYRLPSDHEWSCAVGIGEREDAANQPDEKDSKIEDVFPWGSQWPPPDEAGNYGGEELQPTVAAAKYKYLKGLLVGRRDKYVTTAPVGSFAANRFGIHDLGGNVWEPTEDCYNSKQIERLVRGAAWSTYSRVSLLSAERYVATMNYKGSDRGFRCVLDSTAQTTSPSLPVSSSPSSATQAALFTNTLGMKFVPVPGTPTLFSMWDTRVADYAAYARVHKVGGGWATQQKDGVPVSRDPEYPVVGVSWEDANAFCKWLTEKESAEGKLPKGCKYRLPTDAEWSLAVGLANETGATPAEKSGTNGVDFPWGIAYPPKEKVGNYADEAFHAKFPNKKDGDADDPDAVKNPAAQNWIEGYNDGFATTSPVGCFPANAYGLYDMCGNVWQWCEDWFDKSQKDRVLRGASWGNGDRGLLLSSRRFHYAPGGCLSHYGFRCVLAPATSAPPASATAQTASVTLANATQAVPFVNTLGMKFVPVPGTKVLFSIWETRVLDYAAYARVNTVDESWTKQQAAGVPAGRGQDHPVCGVSWDDANAFCAWLTEKESAEGKLLNGARYRLPTDEEWSRAVGLTYEQGTTPAEKDGQNQVDYPWGRDVPPKGTVGNYADSRWHDKFPNEMWLKDYTDGYATTAPVGSFTPNPDGIYDLGGNVWEWCGDWYDSSQKERVLRGGGWGGTAQNRLLSSLRGRVTPPSHLKDIGFRCVLASTTVSSSPATATKDTPPVITDWHDVMDVAKDLLPKVGGASIEEKDGWIIAKTRSLGGCTLTSTNLAATAVRGSIRGAINVSIRSQAAGQGGYYTIEFQEGGKGQITRSEHNVSGKSVKTVLKEFAMSKPAEHDFLIVMIEDELRLWVDGTLSATTHDRRFAAGTIGLMMPKAGAAVRDLAITEVPVTGAAPARDQSRDRTAALRVLEKGGTVQVHTAKGTQTITSAAAVPAGEFALEVVQVQTSQPNEFNDEDMALLASLPKLKSVELNNTKVTGAALAVLKTLPALDFVSLNGIKPLRDEDLLPLKECRSLVRLVLHNVGDKLSPAGLEPIFELDQLRELGLSRIALRDGDLKKIAGLRKLQKLNVSGDTQSSAALEQLKALPDLEWLTLDLNHLDRPVDFASFPRLTKITTPGLTSAGLKNLAFATRLESLDASLQPLSAGLLTQLAEVCQGLKELNLNVDRALPPGTSFTSLPKLESLIITVFKGDSLFDDAALLDLAKEGKLKRVAIVSAPRLTSQGIAAFQKLRPDVKIEGAGVPNTTERANPPGK